MVLFSPLGERVLAKPMKYVSLARLTLSLVSCTGVMAVAVSLVRSVRVYRSALQPQMCQCVYL